MSAPPAAVASRVLVVDDEPSMRALVSRMLKREFDVVVLEADDGLTALDRLLAESVDLVLLDLSMPVISGLETLEAIRQSRTFADLPVMVLTGQADEERVRKALALGVQDVLAKPFTIATFRERVGRVLQARHRPQPVVTPGGPDISAAHHMVIVDASAEFRSLAAHHFRKLCLVDEAEHEFAALKHCLRATVDFLLIGSTSELSSVDVLARKIRGIPALKGVKLFAAVPPSEIEPTRALGLFDAVLVRGADYAFERSLTRAFGEATLARLLLHPDSSCVTDFFRGVLEHFERLLGPSVRQHETPPCALAQSRWLVAGVAVRCGGLTWDVRLRCPLAVALEIVGAEESVETDVLAGVQLSEVMGRIVLDLSKELRAALLQRGLASTVLPPRLSVTGAAGAIPESSETIGARRWYLTPQQGAAALELAPQPRA